MIELKQILGIGSAQEKSLKQVGIDSVETLLLACQWEKQRLRLATRTGISGTAILQWAFQADLLRIDGVEPEYARLLREAGVKSVTELSCWDASHLYKRVLEIMKVRTSACTPPDEVKIADWITQAHKMPRVLEY